MSRLEGSQTVRLTAILAGITIAGAAHAGLGDDCPGAGLVLGEQKIAALSGGFVGPLHADDRLGRSPTGIGDVDGDGVTDLAVGAFRDDDGGVDRGAVYILFMNADGTVRAEQKISSTQGAFIGPLDDGDQFGISVSELGDFDGDGIPDIAVGAYYDDDGGIDRGSVYILFLNADGTVKSQRKISSTQGSLAGPLDDQDNFGTSLACLGDLNSDGVLDLAVGALNDDDGGVQHGAVYILFLNADGTVATEQKISSTHGGLIGPLDASDTFGVSSASLGDIDGDGVMDIAVGAYRDDDGGSDRGAVYVLFLNSNGTVKAEQKLSSTQGSLVGPLDNGDRFGSSVAGLGDLDADGVPDVAVGVVFDDDGGTDRGAVYVLRLNSNGTVHSEQKISSTAGALAGPLDDSDGFGNGAGRIGDLNADGVPDLVVGAYGDDEGAVDAGAVYILFLDGCPAVPVIVTNPQGVLVGPAPTLVTFEVTAGGAPALAYQWRRDTVDLLDDGNITGAHTPTLQVSGASDADEGVYDCVVSNSLGQVTSIGAVLGVRAWPCIPDLTHDGVLNFFDVAEFLSLFSAGCP